MRICHIIESAGGGSGQIVIDLATAQVAAGDDVTIIYGNQRVEPQFIAALSAIGPRIRVFPIPMLREIGLLDLVAGGRLYFLLRRAGPFDIVHSHSSKAGALARLAGLFLPKAIQVYAPHAFMTMAPGALRRYAWIERGLSWLCQAIICTSPHEMKHARDDLRMAARKLHMIPNGIDLKPSVDRVSVRNRLGYNDKNYVVGFVGRLVAQKNPERLVSAFSLAASRLPELRLVIVGEGPLREEVDQQLASCSFGDRAVILSGHSGRATIPGFDCLVCSSDYEGFGLVIVEALAAGVPVVCTPVGIAQDAILSGKSGFVVPDFRAESIAQAIMRLASLDRHAREALAKAAVEHAKTFDVNTMCRLTKELYMRLLFLRTAPQKRVHPEAIPRPDPIGRKRSGISSRVVDHEPAD